MVSMLILAIFFSMGSRAVFSPLMPALREEMGFSLATAGSLFLLVSMSYGIAMLLAGFLSSRLGHGRTVVTSLAIIALGLLISAASRGTALLAAGMILIGAAAGIYPASGLAMINTGIPASRRDRALSFHEIGPNLALLLSPLFVLALQPLWGWRGVLLCMSGISALAAAVFLRWGAPGSGRGAAPNIRILKDLLRSGRLWLGMMLLIAANAGVQGVYSILPAYLVEKSGFSPELVNLLLSISRISGVLILLRAGSLIGRFGRRRTIFWILVFSALCTGLIGLVRGGWVAAAVVLQPALLAGMFPPLLSSIADIGEPRYQNLTYSLAITAGVGIGGGGAPVLMGFLADHSLGWAGFLTVALFMLASAWLLHKTPSFGREPRN